MPHEPHRAAKKSRNSALDEEISLIRKECIRISAEVEQDFVISLGLSSYLQTTEPDSNLRNRAEKKPSIRNRTDPAQIHGATDRPETEGGEAR
jgi:hypothetical protein